jgi:hypothetical protein
LGMARFEGDIVGAGRVGVARLAGLLGRTCDSVAGNPEPSAAHNLLHQRVHAYAHRMGREAVACRPDRVVQR